MSKSDVPEPRQAIFDELGVEKTGDSSNLFVSLSNMDVADLICEGQIEGLVSGEHRFVGNIGETGYQSSEFDAYTALDENGNCNTGLGFLRSIFWNETPIVDKDGFYNFQEVNVEWNEGLPQGKLPTLNPNLPNDKNLKGESEFELTLFRNIGERLFGPTIDLNKAPGYYHEDDPDNNSPTILGEIDRNAKTYTISNKECVGVRVNIRVTRLLEQIQDDVKDNIEVQKGDKDSDGFFAQPKGTAKDGKQQEFGAGDMRARKIKYQIYTRPLFDTRHLETSPLGADNSDNPLFVKWKTKPDIDDVIFGRIEEPYVRSVDIDLSGLAWKELNPREVNYDYFIGWEIKIVRLTPDSVHTFLKNESFIDSIIEVYDSKLRYPYSAMVYSKFSAEFFSRIPSRAYDTKLLKVKIPNNYDPILRSYDESLGFWDGCFKARKAWTNNPAWCFYDIITNNRYGLGDYIDAQYVDKWTLYEVAKYCDTLVSDGKGGLEPRFTLNHIITSREEAYKVVNDLASAFRSLVYYAFGNIYVSQDRPKDPIYQFTTSNVVDGLFNYSSSAKKARHTVAIVRYNDKNNLYKPSISYTEDQAGIQRYGIREIETTAIGCSSEGQAKRFGEWILRSEILETESVTFTAGQEAMYVRPGDIISVYDEFRNDRKLAGRTFQVKELNSGIIPSAMVPSEISSSDYHITGNSIIIDKPIEFTADKEYKLSLLTPTSYFEPAQITPTECEETVTTTTIPATTEEEVEEKAYKIYKNYTTEDSLYGFPTANNFTTLISTFSTTNTVTVDPEKGKFTFNYQSYKDASTPGRQDKSGHPQRFVLSYEKDGQTNFLNLQNGEFSTDEFAGSFYIGSKFLLSGPDSKQGTGANENGDLIGCLDSYGDGDAAAVAERNFLLNNGQVKKEELTDGMSNAEDRLNDAKTFKQGRLATLAYAEGVRTFTKPEGVTTITIKTVHPINTTSTSDGGPSSISSIFRIGLVRNSKISIKESTEEKIVETITTRATNTDKALTSAEIPEIRRNQIQTVTFSGFQALTHTGNYSSDFSVGGSGIVTQIFLDSATQNLDFTGHVITGYNTSSVIGDLANGDGQEYSATYENYSGSNLVWSIEPVVSDMTSNRDYTLDKELASGHSQEYRIINIIENEKKYDISAIEYTEIKFEEKLAASDGGGGSKGGIGGPPENPRAEEEETDPPSNDGGGGGPENPVPTEGEEGACCEDRGDEKICHPEFKRSECVELDDKLKELGLGGASFHKDKSCEEIDCKPPIIPPPVDPLPPVDEIQKFLNLNFKMHFDMSSISQNPNWKLKIITDREAFENGSEFGIDTALSFEAAMGKYYKNILDDFDGDISCEEAVEKGLYASVEECHADDYQTKVNNYGSDLVAYRTMHFDKSGKFGVFLFAEGDECSKHSLYGKKPVDTWSNKFLYPQFYGDQGLSGKFAEPEWESEFAKESCKVPPSDFVILYVREANANSITTGSVWNEQLRNGHIYYTTIPDEEYILTVQHALYKFPDFIRDGDGKPLTKEQIRKARSDGDTLQDIRDIKFSELTHNEVNERGIKPYTESCLCDETNTTSFIASIEGLSPTDAIAATPSESDKAEPFSDINLEFTEGIVKGTNVSKFHTITREDMKRLSICANAASDISGKIFNFTDIKPETIFGEGTNSDEDKAVYRKLKNGQQENLVDYIADGQYVMFTVTLIPNRKVPNIDCHDQVGFRFTFAFNLKDTPVLPSPSDCNQDPVFVAETRVDYSQDASTTPAHRAKAQPKLYDTPLGIRNPRVQDNLGDFIKLDLPGRMQRVMGDNGEYVKKLNITDCLFLAGQRRRSSLAFSHVIAGLDDSDEEVIKANEKAGAIIKGRKYFSEHHNGYFLLPFPELQTNFIAGSDVGGLGEVITMITPQLAATACKKTNSKQMSNKDNDLEFNVHFECATFDSFTNIALDNTSLFVGTAE